MSDVIAITTSNEFQFHGFQFHGFQLQYDSTKLTKYQLFLQSILSLTIDQQKSVLLEDFIEEFSTVLTLCILFVKTFICYTYSDVSTGTNRKSTNVIADKIISENQKLLRNDIEVSAIVIPEEHSENIARNVPVENVLEHVDSNISTTTIDNNLISNNLIINSSSSASSSASGTDSNNNNNNNSNNNNSNYNDTNITTTTSTNSTNILITNACTDNDTYNLTASTVTAITTNIGSVSTDTCAGVSTGTGASVSTGTGASVSTGTGASLSTTTAVGCESGTDTGLSVSTDIGSKIFLSELIESSLSVAKIFCDVSFSNAGIGLQEKQQLGEGAREKIIQDKILAR